MPMNGTWPAWAGGSTAQPAQAVAPSNTPRAPQHLSLTGAARGLVRLTSDPAHEGRPMLSPDGTKLLATSWRDEVVDNAYTGNIVEQEIIGLRTDGHGRTTYSKRNAGATSAAWLGKSYVYVSNAMGAWNLVRAVKPVPGSAASVVVRGDEAPELGGVAGSRDGKLIAFHTKVRDVWTIGVVHADGSDLVMLTEGMYPRFSPDGARIAFERQVNDHWQVFTVDSDAGSDLTQVTDDAADSGMVDWSPDGKWLVYASTAGAQRFPQVQGTYNLFAIHPDGSALTQITDGPAKTTEPSWGQDGRIYFTSNEAGNFDLWKLEPVL
jgi:TolB protein